MPGLAVVTAAELIHNESGFPDHTGGENGRHLLLEGLEGDVAQRDQHSGQAGGRRATPSPFGPLNRVTKNPGPQEPGADMTRSSAGMIHAIRS